MNNLIKLGTEGARIVADDPWTWVREAQDAYGLLAVRASMALALRGLGLDREEAFARADTLWSARLG